jgi:hypothetical protein
MSTRKARNHRMRNLLLQNYPWILVSGAVRSSDFEYLLQPKLNRQEPCTCLYVLHCGKHFRHHLPRLPILPHLPAHLSHLPTDHRRQHRGKSPSSTVLVCLLSDRERWTHFFSSAGFSSRLGNPCFY